MKSGYAGPPPGRFSITEGGVGSQNSPYPHPQWNGSFLSLRGRHIAGWIQTYLASWVHWPGDRRMHLFRRGAGLRAPSRFCGAVTLQRGADSGGGSATATAAAAATAARRAALAPAGRSLQSLKRLSLRVRNARRARSCSPLALDQREQMLPGC